MKRDFASEQCRLTEFEAKIEARLLALEWTVCQAMLAIILNSGVNPMDFLKRQRQDTVNAARLYTVPELADAALSDLISAELENAIDRLATLQRDLLATYQKMKGGL